MDKQSSRHDIQEPRNVDDRVSAHEIADALDEYNSWRRGDDSEQPDPKKLGQLIDDAAFMLRHLSGTPSSMQFSPMGARKYQQMRNDGYENCGVAMQRSEPDGCITRAWVGMGGMILWPRTECEAGIERAKIADLEREVKHWKSNHATEVRRAHLLKERTDMPMERTAAYHQWESDLASLFAMTGEVNRLRALKFPTYLRKMWSGSEVQEWINQNFAK